MPNFDTPKTPTAFVESSLRTCVEAERLAQDDINDRWLLEARIHTAVQAFTAALAIETLRRHAPAAALDLAQQLDRVFTAGDIGGPALRAADALGFDADQWIAEYEERAARRAAKAATA